MSFVLLWLAAMFPVVFSPGPANVVFAASGAQVGLKRSLPLMLGIDCVLLIKSVVVGLGFGVLFERYPVLLNSLQFLGAFYLAYLAFTFLKVTAKTKSSLDVALTFKDGVLLQLFNPKGWMLVLLMFSSFSELATSEFGAQGVPILIVMLLVLNLSTHLVWISAGAAINRLIRGARAQQIQAIVFCISLLAVAVWLLLDNPLWQTL